jgi:hypothetical protein
MNPITVLGLTHALLCLPITLLSASEKEKILVPKDYKLVYQQDFKSEKSLGEFVATDKRVWKWGSDKGVGYIEHFGKSKYKYKVRSPYNIALVDGIEVKDFVLIAKLRQTGKEYGHRDMCLFYNFKDRSHFYYTHIASVTDNHAHNCFIVNDKPRTKISHETTKGHKWGSREWHDIRLVREFESGKIEVYVNDFEKPIMRAKDKTFDWGRIGFGSFDDTGRIAGVKLYAPESRKVKAADPFKEGRQ